MNISRKNRQLIKLLLCGFIVLFVNTAVAHVYFRVITDSTSGLSVKLLNTNHMSCPLVAVDAIKIYGPPGRINLYNQYVCHYSHGSVTQFKHASAALKLTINGISCTVTFSALQILDTDPMTASITVSKCTKSKGFIYSITHSGSDTNPVRNIKVNGP